ncbi:MAG: hypothetical protein IT451_11910 [Candidatus Brocadia sp.]|nr:hypothetical protein [Candidatus Brocadia sp.]
MNYAKKRYYELAKSKVVKILRDDEFCKTTAIFPERGKVVVMERLYAHTPNRSGGKDNISYALYKSNELPY